MRPFVVLLGMSIGCETGTDTGGPTAPTDSTTTDTETEVSTAEVYGLGLIVLSSSAFSDSTSAFAYFYIAADDTWVPDSTVAEFGDCTTYKFLPPTTIPERLKEHSAGDIRLEVDGYEIDTLSFEGGEYERVLKFGQSWVGGETLTATMAGDEAAAGELSLIAPAVLDFDGPFPSPFLDDPISVAEDWVLTWDPVDADVFRLTAGAVNSEGNGLEVECHFDARAGTATVPAAALASLAGLDGSVATQLDSYDVLDAKDSDGNVWRTTFIAGASVTYGGMSAYWSTHFE
jgi:hypothetical protein